MLLTIDAGNTNIVFALFDEENREHFTQWRIATSAERTADEYFVWLDQLIRHEGLDGRPVVGAIISTVVPRALFNLKTLCRRYFDCDPLVVGDSQTKLGIEVKMPNPRGAGADRLVNAVGAHMDYPGPLILLDFGTATTFDVVDSDGAFLGGSFAPGINLSLEALHRAAAQLPTVAVARPTKVIGTDTVSAMQSGVYWGYLGLIEGITRQIQQEYGASMTTVATGGLAPLFAEATKAIDHVDQNLTVRGLVEIYFRNQPK
jgi:type III pantothenate kinase